MGLGEKSKGARAREIFSPYHERITSELRQRNGPAAVLIALHSFTPLFKGVARPWHAGLLYNRDPRLARHLLALLQQEAGFNIGDNEPYFVSDATDYTIPVHGERRGLPHALIEVRQDLIADARGQQQWSDILARLLPQAYRELIGAAAAGSAG